MTNKQYENGEHLNIHNATKEQLKLMVKDRDETIKRLQKELNEKQAALYPFLLSSPSILNQSESKKFGIDAKSLFGYFSLYRLYAVLYNSSTKSRFIIFPPFST